MGCCLYQVLAIVLIGLNFSVKEGKSQWECLVYCDKGCDPHHYKVWYSVYACKKAIGNCNCGVKEDKSQLRVSSEPDCNRTCDIFTYCGKYDHNCHRARKDCNCRIDRWWPFIFMAVFGVLLLGLLLMSLHSRLDWSTVQIQHNQGLIEPTVRVRPSLSQPKTTHSPSARVPAAGAPVRTQVLYSYDGLPSYSEVTLENSNKPIPFSYVAT